MAGSQDQDFPEGPPPEVPEEFAAAYREAYRRALETGDGEVGEPPVESAAATGSTRVTEYRTASPRWRAPLLAALAVLALIAGAWVIGQLLGSGGGEPTGSGSAPPPSTRTAAPSAQEASPPKKKPEPERPRHRGPVTPLQVSALAATCTMDSGVDAAGRRVDYRVENAVDDDLESAWRCEADAVGERLVIRLPAGSEVAEVGLVPGYAKTDPANGADRYAENNRILRVRWTLDTGVEVVQRLDPDPRNRALQTIRVPRTATGRVVLEILAVAEGSRGTTAISEIRLSAPR